MSSNSSTSLDICLFEVFISFEIRTDLFQCFCTFVVRLFDFSVCFGVFYFTKIAFTCIALLSSSDGQRPTS